LDIGWLVAVVDIIPVGLHLEGELAKRDNEVERWNNNIKQWADVKD